MSGGRLLKAVIWEKYFYYTTSDESSKDPAAVHIYLRVFPLALLILEHLCNQHVYPYAFLWWTFPFFSFSDLWSIPATNTGYYNSIIIYKNYKD